MDKSLGININYASLLRFALPTMISNVFTGIYSTVDGIFVSNFVGTQALSAVNIVMPIILISVAVGAMFGTGGSALVSKKLGELKVDKAKQNMTLLILVTLIASSILSVIGFIFREPILYALGADANVYSFCDEYAGTIFFILPFAITGILFQMFFIAEGKPKLSMLSSFIGGFTNIILDYVLIVNFNLGLRGAAIATGLGYSTTTFIGIIFFSLNKKGTLKFTVPKFDLKVIWKSCSNGCSEMVSLLSTSVAIITINNIIIRLAGIYGVSAVTIISYTQHLLSSIYMGYSIGIAPLTSFNFGKKDLDNLKKIHRISMRVIFIISILAIVMSLMLAKPIIGIFATQDSSVFSLAMEGFRIFSISLLFMGINIYISSLFTALNNGKISGILSFLRTLVFLITLLMILPSILGTIGVWISMPLAEILSVLVAIFYLKKYKNVYHYA